MTPDAPQPLDQVRAVRERDLIATMVGLALAAVLGIAPVARAATLPPGFHDQLVMSGLSMPVGFAFVPDGRLLVVQKDGTVRLIVDGKLGGFDPMATVDSVQNGFLEQGLLGIAVDPGWPGRPFVYTYYDALGENIRISRYQAKGDLTTPTSVNLWIDPTTRYDLLRDIPDVNVSHNGGTLRFGPDGMLYAGLAEDWYRCGSQDTTTFHGVILRLDVDGLPPGPGGPANKALLAPPDNPFISSPDPNARLVWAMGLRNPFRFHIDPMTGTLFIADVGWDDYEEVDYVPHGGMNFGWPFYEGPLSHLDSCDPNPAWVYTGPTYGYSHAGLTVACVMSAGFYRPTACGSCNFPAEYHGDYFLTDFYSGWIRRLKQTNGTWNLAPPVPGQPDATNWGLGVAEASDFLEGPDGALWYCRTAVNFQDNSGEVHRIYYAPQSSTGVPPALEHLASFDPPTPSPAHGPVRLSYTLARAAEVRLDVYDATGRRVRTVTGATALPPGSHQATWDGRDDDGRAVASGVYLARLVVQGRAYEQRVPLLH
jgi:glucose/arabinose dehydrogenase